MSSCASGNHSWHKSRGKMCPRHWGRSVTRLLSPPWHRIRIWEKVGMQWSYLCFDVLAAHWWFACFWVSVISHVLVLMYICWLNMHVHLLMYLCSSCSHVHLLIEYACAFVHDWFRQKLSNKIGLPVKINQKSIPWHFFSFTVEHMRSWHAVMSHFCSLACFRGHDMHRVDHTTGQYQVSDSACR